MREAGAGVREAWCARGWGRGVRGLVCARPGVREAWRAVRERRVVKRVLPTERDCMLLVSRTMVRLACWSAARSVGSAESNKTLLACRTRCQRTSIGRARRRR